MSWTSPTAIDNSGVVTLASRSHRSGQFFATGTTTVTYRFVDGSGNSAICSIDVVIIEGNGPPQSKNNICKYKIFQCHIFGRSTGKRYVRIVTVDTALWAE